MVYELFSLSVFFFKEIWLSLWMDHWIIGSLDSFQKLIQEQNTAVLLWDAK